MKPIKIECLDQRELRIGWDGEHNWRPITFDCSWLLEKHPGGVISLWIRPRGSSAAFPVALEQDGNVITWTPTTAELGCGSGKLQFECDDGNDVGKSPVGFYGVAESLITGGEHPEELPTWATQVMQFVAEKVEQVKAAVQEIAGKIAEALPPAIADYLLEHPIEVDVDSELSSTSENPVQNKVIKEALDGKGTYSKPSGGIPASDLADGVIPAAVTEQDVAGWGFTKNTGTYSKPSGGIPASDLATGVIPSVPAMASELDMSDWDNGKIVDAAVLAADFTAALTSLNAVAARLEALADSDDTTLDQLSEIVAYIKNNKSLIDGVTTSKVSVTDIVNSLVSTETGKPLSAAQGRALKALIDAIVVPTAVSQLTNDEGFQTAAQVQTAVSGKEDETETVTKTAADTSATLQENKFYIWPEMTALTITCPATGGPYAFRFTSGATATTLTMTGITMPDGFSVEANTVYEINVYEGYGLAVSWEVSA